MKFVLFHLLPVISFVIPLSSFAAEVEESIDPETYCITHAKRLILENDQTVNLPEAIRQYGSSQDI